MHDRVHQILYWNRRREGGMREEGKEIRTEQMDQTNVLPTQDRVHLCPNKIKEKGENSNQKIRTVQQ